MTEIAPVRLNRTVALWSGLYLLLAVIGWLLVGRAAEPDANFVVYRFVANVAAGRGLIYWTPGLTVTTYPLAPLLLAALAKLGLGLPTTGGMLSILVIVIGAVALSRLVGNPWAGLAYVLVTALQPSPVTNMLLALALGSLYLAKHKRYGWAGVLMGAALLTDPAVLPLALLVMLILISQDGWQTARRYLIPPLLIPTIGLTIINLTLRPNVMILPGTPSVIALFLVIAALIILVRAWKSIRATPYSAALAVWSVIAIAAALLNKGLPTAIIYPGLIAVVAQVRWRLFVVLVACADAIIFFFYGGIANAPSSAAIGQWIAANIHDPATTIATADLGALSFYANRPIIDMSGKISVNPFDATFFARNAPDAIVLRDGTTVPWANFGTTYATTHKQDGQTVYQRVVNFSPLDDHRVDLSFGVETSRDDLHLDNVAVADTLHPGDMVRVRLDWMLAYPTSYEITLQLDLLDAQGKSIAHAADRFPPEAWQVDSVSTYQLLLLPNNLPDGKLSLALAVGIHDGSFGTRQIATVSVSK